MQRAEGNRWITDTRIVFNTSDDGKPGYLEKLIADQKPVTEYSRVVPKDAISFFTDQRVVISRWS